MARNGWPGWQATTALIVVAGLAGLLASTAWAQTPPIVQQVATPTATAASSTASSSWLAAIPSGGWAVIGGAVGAVIAGWFSTKQLKTTLAHQERQLKETHRHQADQEAQKDAWSLRDRSHDREIVAYEQLYGAALMMVQDARRLQSLAERGASEQEMASFREKSYRPTRAAIIAAQRVTLRLITTKEGQAIYDTFDTMVKAYFLLMMAPARFRGQGERERLEHLLSELQKAMAARLDALRRTVTRPPDDPPAVG